MEEDDNDDGDIMERGDNLPMMPMETAAESVGIGNNLWCFVLLYLSLEAPRRWCWVRRRR
jgi:hypothetical protein